MISERSQRKLNFTVACTHGAYYEIISLGLQQIASALVITNLHCHLIIISVLYTAMALFHNPPGSNLLQTIRADMKYSHNFLWLFVFSLSWANELRSTGYSANVQGFAKGGGFGDTPCESHHAFEKQTTL